MKVLTSCFSKSILVHFLGFTIETEMECVPVAECVAIADGVAGMGITDWFGSTSLPVTESKKDPCFLIF